VANHPDAPADPLLPLVFLDRRLTLTAKNSPKGPTCATRLPRRVDSGGSGPRRMPPIAGPARATPATPGDASPGMGLPAATT
jgi:hypothetical protein